MPYYLGIDGGGTKTTCAVGDDTRLLASATAGPSNVVRVGESETRQSLQQSVRQACAAAGIVPTQVAHTCVGGSGAARPELAAIVRSIVAEIIPTPVDVVGDIQIALEAAFDTGPGVIVVGGTGSIAYGRNAQGKTARAGGWGFAIGDEGSAHWIGRTAVSAVLRASDPIFDTKSDSKSKTKTETKTEKKYTAQPSDSSLAAALLKTWGVTSLLDLARAANSIPPPDYSALFPAVAASNDDIALQVLSSAGKELAQVAAVVMRSLFPEEAVAMIPVAMTGGVFRHAPLVRQVFYNELRTLDPRAEINPQVVEPVEGALRLARKAAAKSVSSR